MATIGRRGDALRFALRRVGAVTLVALVAWSAVKAVAEYAADDEPSAAAVGNAVPTGATDDGDPVAAAGAAADPGLTAGADSSPAATDTTGTTTTTTTTQPTVTTTLPARTGPPSPENPARVFIVGDSDAGTFGPYLKQLLDGTGFTETELDYVVSSGLSRPDFFNWPDELRTKLPAVNPDIVVVTFGGNDAQGLAEPNGNFILGTPTEENRAEWIAEYQRRALEVLDLLLADEREVIWVGIPNDDNPEVTARMAIQDEAAKAAAAERGVVFVDTWKRFSGRDGGWAEFVIDPRDGVGKDVRADDGFHLNTTGAEILAIDIAQAVVAALRDLGANV